MIGWPTGIALLLMIALQSVALIIVILRLRKLELRCRSHERQQARKPEATMMLLTALTILGKAFALRTGTYTSRSRR